MSRCGSVLNALLVFSAVQFPKLYACLKLHLNSIAQFHVKTVLILCRHPVAMLCVLWLGSSVGNLKPEEAVDFFQSVQQSAGPNVQVRHYFLFGKL